MSFDFLLANLDMLWAATKATLYMTFVSAFFAYILGLPLGVYLYVSRLDSLRPRSRFSRALARVVEVLSGAARAGVGWVVNIGRSVPFLILILVLMPLTRAIVGKSIGSTAAIVPLVIASIPFVARLTESSLSELDQGLIEAARTMGATRWQIICKVLLPETVPALVRGLSIAIITLVGYVAMAGTVGGGGLGDVAIRYGFHRYQPDMLLATLVILIVMVQVVQSVFSLISKKIDKRNIS